MIRNMYIGLFVAVLAAVLLAAPSGLCMTPVVVLEASSTEAYDLGVTNVLDGDTGTRWSSQFADDQWLVVDFRTVVTIDAVCIQWQDAYPNEYKFLTSNDEAAWNEFFGVTNFTGGSVTNTFSPQAGRFLKIHAVTRATSWGNSIWELDVRRNGTSVVPAYCDIEEKHTFHVDVNQAFYAPQIKKTAVLRAIEPLTGGSFTITDTNSATVLSGSPTYWGSYWNRYFWTIDFSTITNEGPYVIAAQFDQGTQSQAQVFINSTNIIASMDKTLDYFMTQRCGTNVPGWHLACHLDDGQLPNTNRYHAEGGWHDCAAWDKEMYTSWLPVYCFSAIAAEAEDPWRDRMTGEARWGADWIMKMVDTNGYTWCHVESGYVADENMNAVWQTGTPTDNVWSNGDERRLQVQAWGLEEPCQALAAGALARMGDLLRDDDPAYAAQCFQKAGQMIYYLMQREDQSWAGLPNDTSPYIDYQAGRLLADIYLYGTDPNVDYYADARRRIDIIANQFCRPDGDLRNTSGVDDSSSIQKIGPYAALMFMYDFAKRAPDDPAVDTVKTVFRNFMENQATQRTDPTPYGQAQVICTNDQRSFAWPEDGDAISQGRNGYWLAMATVCFMADDLLETNAYADIAAGQIDWVLGKNPFSVSTVADVGYRFPSMYTKWTFMTNHPGENGVIPGGVINGVGGNNADEPMLDMREVDLTDWLSNEYWNPPTAWLSIACWHYYRWAEGLTHTPDYDLRDAYLAYLAPRRPELIRNFTEAEHYLREVGSDGLDYKATASGGQVLGMGWGDKHNDYVDYELFVTRPLVNPILHVRYACGVYTGRSFRVEWNNVYQSTLSCTNTGGWGDSSADYSWATASLSTTTTGIYKLTFVAQDEVQPVNIDYWYFTEGQSASREGEDYDSQVGSGGTDLKAGASEGEVLGDGWGISTASEATYANISAGSQTGAWLHVWYACAVSSGRVLNAYLDGELRAHLVCTETPGWGNATSDFNVVSACIGPMDGSSETIKFTVPGPGDGVNLDCFYVGTTGPEFLPWDADGDGLGDDQELVCGTSSSAQDTDGDGISDGDEVQFVRWGQVSDPLLLDTDGDLLDDGEELVSGTDPSDQDSFFYIPAPDVSGDGEVVLSWPSVTNRFYTLSRADGLVGEPTPFTNIAVDLPATPPLNCHTDSVVGVGPYFYRLRVRQ